MIATVNAWVIYKVHLIDTSPHQFLVQLAERMVAVGKTRFGLKWKINGGHPSNVKNIMANVGDHLPVKGKMRRWCAKNKKEWRTKMVCTMCRVALCKNCFTDYHS